MTDPENANPLDGWRYHLEPPVHVWPDGPDARFVHELDGEGCPCGLDVERLRDGDLIVHHSLDGRELAE